MQNENSIIVSLIRNLIINNHYTCVNNIYYNKFECDLLSFTSSDLLVEYEVKVSRPDYFREFTGKDGKYMSIIKGERINRYYIACPEGLIKEDEVAPYAGLIWVTESGHTNKVKDAPLLTKNKFLHMKSRIDGIGLRRYIGGYIAKTNS